MSALRQGFLRPEVVAEPLVNGFWAVPHLLSPATAAFTVAQRHLPLLKSFLQSPAAHAEAAKSALLSGGLFLDLPPTAVEAVRALVAKIETEAAPQLQFVQAFKELEALLLREAKGECIEPLYAKIPPQLRGLVELRYDLHHRPSARLIEPLLYAEGLHREQAQSVRLTDDLPDGRPFYLTPRLEPGLRVARPFRDPAFTALARARFEATEVEALREQLGLGAEDTARFAQLFTAQGPAPYPAFDGEGLRIRFFGHATLLIEARGLNILTDPTFASAPGPTPRLRLSDLPERIDFVLITHAHPDHCSLEALLQLRPRLGTVVVPRAASDSLADPSLKRALQAAGFAEVRELDELEELTLPGGGSLLGLPFLGEHCDLPIRTKIVYRLRAGGRTVLALGDTNLPDPAVYDRIRPFASGADALFVGLESEGAPMSWGYGGLFALPPSRKIDQGRRSASADAAKGQAMVERLSPRRVYVYSMGLEPWMRHVMGTTFDGEAPQVKGAEALIAACRAQGIDAAHLTFQGELRIP